jgi:hypothetical protein
MAENNSVDGNKSDDPCKGHQECSQHLAALNEKIEAFTKKYEKNNEQTDARESSRSKVEKLVLIGVAVYTVITAIILCVQRDSEIRQLRAYVGLDNSVPTRLDPDRITTAMNNFGQTPANHTKFFSNWEFLPYGEGLPDKFGFPEKPVCEENKGTLLSSAIVFPKDAVKAQRMHCAGEVDKLMQAERKGLNAFLYGHIEYLDIFGYSRRTNFCFLYNQPGGLVLCDRYNEIDPR